MPESDYQITFPSQKYIDGGGGKPPHPVKLLGDKTGVRFVIAGTAPAKTHKDNLLVYVRGPGDKPIEGFYVTRAADKTHRTATRTETRAVWVAVCTFAPNQLNERDTYTFVLARRAGPSSPWLAVNRGIERVRFKHYQRGAPDPNARRGYRSPDILFPDDDTEHSHWGFTPYWLLTESNETVTPADVTLGDPLKPLDRADSAETPFFTDLGSFWWGVFDVVDTDGSCDLTVKSSLNNADTIRRLTFVD